ncbi:MAG: TRAP transporter small permease [Pseudomonadota bacterium]
MYSTATRVIAQMCLWLGGIAMAIMGLITVADVFMRYVFLSPLPGTSEHTQLLLAVIVFSGLVLVTREGTHIVVSLFEGPLDRLAPGLFDRVNFWANVAGLLFILYAMIIATRDMYEFEEETMVMEYPLVYLGIFIVVLLLLAIAQLRHLARHGPSGHEQTE